MTSDADFNLVTEDFVIENNVVKGKVIPSKFADESVGKLIFDNFNRAPEHVAQVDAETGRATTNAYLKDRTVRLAVWMQKQGIGPHDVVSTCTENCLEACIPVISAFYLGAVSNSWPLEILMSIKKAKYFFSLVRPKLMIASESVISLLQEAARLGGVETKFLVMGKALKIDSFEEVIYLQNHASVEAFSPQEIKNLDNPALIMFSSGTSGLPKGVVYSYRCLLQNVLRLYAPVYDEYQCHLWYSSLAWITGLRHALFTLIGNVKRVLHRAFDEEETCRVIQNYQVTHMFLRPSTLMKAGNSDIFPTSELLSLKTIYSGGCKINRAILEILRAKLPRVNIYLSYGMTEIGSVPFSQTVKLTQSDSIGFISPNYQAKIIDTETGQTLGPNLAGELCVLARTKMSGYLNNKEADAEIIDSEGWLHTGDKAYYTEDGEFFIVDRIKEIMKFLDLPISPSELEELLSGHPGVLEVSVVPQPHFLYNERPMAFVVKAPGFEVSAAELTELSKTLGINQLWGRVEFVNQLPRTASGKIDRQELKEMAKTFGQTSRIPAS